MGLTTSLTNAVSGLRTNQDSISILSRNVANAGTPGYHRQSHNVVDYNTQSSSYARSEGAMRAFNQSLQAYYTRQVADTSNTGVQASYLDRLQGFLGKPGSAGSLDTLYGQIKNSMQGVATSPDDFTARSEAVAAAQTMAETLNRLSRNIQEMRKETEGQIASSVHDLNGMLGSLSEVNSRLLDLGMTDSARAALQDQRDRLVSSIAERIDVQADYRPNGTVALMTRSGVGILDNGASIFGFESAGNLDATSEFSSDPNLTRVGKLTLTTPSGLTLDLVQQGVLQGGELAGLVTLRDKTLVEAQAQLDEIAAGLAQAFSTKTTQGTAVPGGLSASVSGMLPGNSMTMTVKVNGTEQRIKIVNTTEAGLDYRDATGARVIGINMQNGTTDVARASSAATQLQFILSNPTSSEGAVPVTVTANNGALEFTSSGTTTITGLTKRSTSQAAQGDGLALSLFVDSGDAAYSGNLDSDPPQKLGFASRISINSAVLADNRMLVQHEVGGTLGDADRPNFILEQLESMDFVSGGDPKKGTTRFQLNGTMGEIIAQVVNFQGASIGATITKADDRQLTLDTIVDQMQTEYGVNIDEEMARLMEIQNAYAANARVVSVVKELLDALFATT